MNKPFDAFALEKIDTPDATAAAYFSTFRSPKATAQDYEDFEMWHTADEANRIAWAKVERAWNGSGALRTDARILQIRERALANKCRPKPWLQHAIAASVVLTLFAGGITLHDRQQAPAGAQLAETRVVSTDVGHQSTFKMTDGSTIVANTATLLEVAESDTRHVAIQRGEAFFAVTKNPAKPFVVTASGLTITALGTQFAVRDTAGSVGITVTEGRVRVDMPRVGGDSQSAVLEPGRELVWKAGNYRTASVQVDRELSWRRGVLDFDHVPLSEAVAQINRYTPQEIVVVSPALARHPISGTFRIGVTRGFLQSLEVAGIAQVENESATRVELVAP